MICLQDRRRAVLAALLASLAALQGQGARAQVLEIGPDGAVTRFEGPAVITSEGAHPLSPSVSRTPRPAAVAQAVNASARRHGLDPALLTALALRESGLREQVVSPKGAIGVMQLMPRTARELGVDPGNTADNIEGGAAYLAALMRRFGGDPVLALAAYNAGPTAVARFKGPPPFRETQAYVNSVLASWTKAAPRAGAKAGM